MNLAMESLGFLKMTKLADGPLNSFSILYAYWKGGDIHHFLIFNIGVTNKLAARTS